MMYLYPLAMSFLGEKHCNMFNANKEFVLYCINFVSVQCSRLEDVTEIILG